MELCEREPVLVLMEEKQKKKRQQSQCTCRNVNESNDLIVNFEKIIHSKNPSFLTVTTTGTYYSS